MHIYLLAVNALGLIIMHYDKYLARNNKWRIPEKTLMGFAVIGGSIGCLLGMYSARHKTRKPKFTVGIPAILVAQILLWNLYM
ncbi:MAG: DUF1294 domain-containing protein [Oscillospiraceae bacterium]|nr:DUF1294 domain-containing protein [Oscillospiraceae bacterium]MBQ8748323.1 DUF1294 domain-containing protein [Oscillospiraceae bacterium]MBQ8881732.1 DUF1294 domain-containing protein [Oscillospiraceae bacterium]